MKTFLCSFALILSCQFVYGQDFNLKFSVGLSDSLTFNEVDWVDADHDGLLDIIAFATNANDQEAILLFKNDSLRQLQFVKYLNTKMTAAAWLLTDADGDNMVDVIGSGTNNGQPVTKIFVNRGGFAFEETEIVNASAGVIKMADFDQDGFLEILLSGKGEGEPFLHILKRGTSGWSVIHDSIKVEATTVGIFDVDDDNDPDIFLAGKDASGTGVTRVYYNQKGFYFTAENFSPAIRGVSRQADLNHDGMFDLLLAGKDSGGEARHAAFLNHGGGFTVSDTLPTADDPQIFAADLNSDGICDISLFGRDAEADTINLILKADPDVALIHTGVLSQAFGDGEYDGDLDLVQLTKGVSEFSLRILENNTETKNLPPVAPSKPIAANIFNRLFLYWDKSSDDHTVANSLTYDVAIQSPGETLMTPHFNLFNGRRLTVSHGNNGTARYVLIHTDGAAPVNFSIQAVDNSLFGSIGSICNGSGGGNSGLCANVETENLEGCKNETVSLSAEGLAHWFSFRDGFLADADILTVDFQKPDTIFSVQRRADCAQIKVYTLAPLQTMIKRIESTQQVCEGTTLHLGVESGWPMVEWSSAVRGFLSGSDSIDYVVTVADTVRARVSDGIECAVQRNTALQISKPVIEIASEAYQILKGQSVQLSVSGGASYQWAPAGSLKEPQSANPIASPLKTTEYVVVATDSLGCTASARIIVMVEETAFVPNLFTPNRDGTNDELKIYGLGQVTGFSFTIYNREGKKVYDTKNISDAVNNGWNGMTGGVDQPSGVYYWNIEGETAAGRRLQLNGRNTGSIVLVR